VRCPLIRSASIALATACSILIQRSRFEPFVMRERPERFCPEICRLLPSDCEAISIVGREPPHVMVALTERREPALLTCAIWQAIFGFILCLRQVMAKNIGRKCGQVRWFPPCSGDAGGRPSRGYLGVGQSWRVTLPPTCSSTVTKRDLISP
jgi:hypothetical protein